MENRLSRLQRETLERQDAPFLQAPLEYNDRSIGAHTRRMVKLLRSRRSVSPCSDAMAHVGALFDRTAARKVPPASQALVACKKGCAHCCVQPVGISAAEVFHLAHVVRQREAAVAALLQAGERIAAAPPERRLFDMRCPLLVDNACSVYAARPMSCRTYASFDLHACITKYVMGGNADILSPAELGPVSNACRTILFASLGLIGRRDFSATYEMKAALSHVLRLDENAEKRWLAGEDVMAGVDVLPDPNPMAVWNIRHTIDNFRATL